MHPCARTLEAKKTRDPRRAPSIGAAGKAVQDGQDSRWREAEEGAQVKIATIERHPVEIAVVSHAKPAGRVIAVSGATREGMDHASSTSNGVVSEDGAESTRSTGSRGTIQSPIGHVAQLRSGILSICHPTGKGMKGRIAGAVGSNAKDGAEVIRPAVIGHAIQITVTGTRETRDGSVSVGTGSERMEDGLHSFRSHPEDGAQIVGSTGGRGSIKTAIGQQGQSLRSCATAIPPEGIQRRGNASAGILKNVPTPKAPPAVVVA